MKTEQILMCVVSLILGMLLFHMLKGVCGCKIVEGAESTSTETGNSPSNVSEVGPNTGSGNSPSNVSEVGFNSKINSGAGSNSDLPPPAKHARGGKIDAALNQIKLGYDMLIDAGSNQKLLFVPMTCPSDKNLNSSQVIGL